MKPPYEITNTILKLLTSISEKIGVVNAAHLQKPSPELRKRNRVKTIKASLEIEGNTLSEDQITAILENKRVIGPKKDIAEVMNTIKVYDRIDEFKPSSIKDFLKAHKLLMKGLIDSAGEFRKKGVGIVKGNKVAHVAPRAANVKFLIADLFEYLKKSDDHPLIKSCVVHYEIEFIHPFMDGNGRMGRLWQTLILLEAYPIFEYLPFETIIKERQEEYYSVLEKSDKTGKSTLFIEFQLRAINDSLEDLLKLQSGTLSQADRVDYFISTFKGNFFTRKDYLNVFKNISPPTASRDLKFALSKNLIEKEGDKRTTKYRVLAG